MGRPTPYPPHKTIVATISAPEVDAGVVRRLVESFGVIDSATDEVPFDFTSYYDREMGPNLKRRLWSLRDLADPASLATLKRRSDAIEAERARLDGTRTVNIDPGMLSLSRLMLATTKGAPHRVPVGDGYSVEVTLLYRHGDWQPLEWTYPDFRSAPVRAWLRSVRERYRGQLREIDPDRAWRL